MYKFRIKNIYHDVFYTSVRKFLSASHAQEEGFKFLQLSRKMDNRADISKKDNFVDIISA